MSSSPKLLPHRGTPVAMRPFSAVTLIALVVGCLVGVTTSASPASATATVPSVNHPIEFTANGYYNNFDGFYDEPAFFPSRRER